MLRRGCNGQTSRALVIPTSPRTDAQWRLRTFLEEVAAKVEHAGLGHWNHSNE